MSSAKEKQFQTLCRTAQTCQKCAGLSERTAVLSELNGNINARILFIAEAPGRQGADRTRKPFSGDKSGANFDKFIASINLRREEIFITNAVLCSPRKTTGANRKPTKKEISNCGNFLQKTVELINPKIIVTLGAVSLEALKTIEYHQFTLKEDVGKILSWNKRTLIPLYHPSPQVLASHRRVGEQFEDYKNLAKAIEKSGI